MISVANNVFDPIAVTSPVMICPKTMLQKTWKVSVTWEKEITSDLKDELIELFQ